MGSIEGVVTQRPPEAERWTRSPNTAAVRFLECLARGDELGLDERTARTFALLEADLVDGGVQPETLGVRGRDLLFRARLLFRPSDYGGHIPPAEAWAEVPEPEEPASGPESGEPNPNDLGRAAQVVR